MTTAQAFSTIRPLPRAPAELPPPPVTSTQRIAHDARPVAGSPDAIAVRPLTSLADVSRAHWDGLFPGRIEGWDYFRACEIAMATGEATGEATVALVAVVGDLPVAALLLFRTSYRLDMEVPNALRPLAGLVGRVAPDLLRVEVLGLGSPLTEECPIGFHPSLSPSARADAFAALIDAANRQSVLEGISMLALKDVADEHVATIDPVLMQRGFRRVPTLPVATLHLPFKHEDEYLATLSPNMRRDLRRKMKSVGGKVTVEVCHSIRGIEDEVAALFDETKARSKVDYDGFDDVPQAYFRAVVESLGDSALIVLCRVDGVLAGFSLSLIERNRVIGKYVGMRYPLAREHDVYFINWMTVVRYCIAHGITWLQAGQTTYKQKFRLGCQLKRSWVYFKHRGRILGPVVRSVGKQLRFDLLDPDLAGQTDALPYLEPTAASLTTRVPLT